MSAVDSLEHVAMARLDGAQILGRAGTLPTLRQQVFYLDLVVLQLGAEADRLMHLDLARELNGGAA